MKNTDILQIIKSTGKSPLGTNSGIPLEYVYGLPVFTVRNSRLCMIIPFLKYKVTGQVDKTLVYPIRYTITVLLPEGRVVGYEDLTCNSAYGKVDFTKPVGFFRHEAVKSWTKGEYKSKKKELLAMYGKIADSILYGAVYSPEEDAAFKKLLNTIIEPSLLPVYKELDEDFYNKYLA